MPNNESVIMQKVMRHIEQKLKRELAKDLIMLEAIVKKHYAKLVIGGNGTVYHSRGGGGLLGSIYKTSIIRNGTQMSAMVTFDGRAIGQSLWGGASVFLPTHLSNGWHWKRPHAVIPNFTDFDGNNAIPNIIAEFNMKKSKYVNLRVIGG